MSVTININGESAAEVLKELQGLASGFTGAVVATEEKASNSKSAKKDKPARKDADKQKQVDPDPAPEKEVVETKEPDVESEPEGDAEDIPSLEDLREKAQEISKTAKNKPKIKALLEEIGVKNITSIPEDQRAAFMAKLEELA